MSKGLDNGHIAIYANAENKKMKSLAIAKNG